MEDMTLVEIYDYVAKWGFPGVLFLILAGNYYRVWYWGWQYNEVKAERDAWKQTAQHYGAITDKSLTALEKK